MQSKLEELISLYRALEIEKQIDYDKFYLYSLITHSTAIEGSTITEIENQIMFDQGVGLKGKSIVEQNMNLDLKCAYEAAVGLAKAHTDITIDLLKELSALVMKNTGKEYRTALGDFSSARGDLRLLNVSAGFGGKSYMNYSKVPAKLEDFCTWLNKERTEAANKTLAELYNLSFAAHYQLVTIHPWADGNGRMARLVMNMIQFEYGLIPSKILTEDKEEYIKALVETREQDDLDIFLKFMTDTMVKNLSSEIKAYRESVGEVQTVTEPPKKTRDKIIALLSENEKLSAAALAQLTGVTPKAVEKQIARLKSEGILERVGPDKGGYWKVKLSLP